MTREKESQSRKEIILACKALIRDFAEQDLEYWINQLRAWCKILEGTEGSHDNRGISKE